MSSSAAKAAASGRALPFPEFVALMAMLISLVALSIDAMLPALPTIGADLGVPAGNEEQLVVSFLFIGLALGQVIYGPLSDATGRKPAIYIGVGLFLIGCLLSYFATSFAMMLAGRVLQGLGAAGPRVVTIAMVRDLFEGRAMARVMSFVMAVFILVPALAPAFGQAVLFVADWRAIFAAFLILALVAVTWLALRQPESLPDERRRPLRVGTLVRGFGEICRNRITLGYTLSAGCIFGAFVGYLTSAQPIFQVEYRLGELFPAAFAVLALAIGAASIVNGRIVMRYGMRRLSRLALLGVALASLLFLAPALATGGVPPLWSLMLYLGLVLFCMGMLFGNLNALAMEPMGHMAGLASAFVGFLSTLISVPLGTAVGWSFDGSVVPLVGGFAVLASLSLGLALWADRGQPPGPVLEGA